MKQKSINLKQYKIIIHVVAKNHLKFVGFRVYRTVRKHYLMWLYLGSQLLD